MKARIPVDPEEVDAAWLTAALDDAGVANGATVIDIGFDGYVGTGQMSRSGRFRLTWSDSRARPSTVICKFPSDDAAVRSSAFQGGLYHNEYLFYSQIASTLSVRVPACWVARYDEATQRCLLVMEDLAESVQADQFEGCSPEQVALVVAQAAALHAPRWGDPALQQIVPGSDDPDRVELRSHLYRTSVEHCLSRLGSGLTDEVVKVVESFSGSIARWLTGTGTPRTLVHGDFRPDNFLFGATGGAPPLAVVDWQTLGLACGPLDIAYFLGGAFPVNDRRVIERDVVEEYRRMLNAYGITYTERDCWRDYSWGTLHGISIAVLATMMATQTERGDRLFTLMISRHAQHAIDLGALELLN